jgi:SPP1 family predicted phage head-tail adaptor
VAISDPVRLLMPIDPGRLDRRVVIQARTNSRDDEGSAIVSYADETTVWAQKVEVNTSEARRLLAVRADASLILRIRYLASLTSQHRLYFEGKYFDVLGDPVEEGRRETMLVTARYTEGDAT